MLLNFGLLGNAILLVVGGLWCREMFHRLPRELAEYRTTTDASTRQVRLVLWGTTILVAMPTLNFRIGILLNLGIL